MADINPAVLLLVARSLDQLGLNYAFVGGCIVNHLLDNASLSPVRPTDDLDIIIEVATNLHYSDVEAALRKSGFMNDSRPGAPICRWIFSGVIVDIMPINGSFLGLNTTWFPEALASVSAWKNCPPGLKIISPVSFIATKLAAFQDRGKSDFFASHDIEDVMTVVDGRSSIVHEIANAPTDIQEYIVTSFRRMHQASNFNEALPGHLPSDEASQSRIPMLREKINAIIRLPV